MSAPPRRRASPARVLIQGAGFLLGLALLGWCARVALSDQNREQITRLGEARFTDVAGLVGLSVAILVVNGLVFWITIRPVRALGATGVVATSCIATFLALLPFKLSIASRVLIHHRRDRVPLMMIGGWFGAVGVTFVGAVGVIAGAAFARARWDLTAPFGVALGAAGLFAFAIATLIGARFFRGEAGHARLEAIVERLAIGPIRRPTRAVVRSRSFENLHRAFDMLGSPSAVGGAITLRLVDAALQAVRFTLAAKVLGVTLDAPSALLLACAHASIGIVSPFGTLGTREAGTLALAAAFGLAGAATASADASEGLAVVLLVVGAVDALTALAMAGLGVAWLRPDRLLRASRAMADGPEA